MGFSWFGTLYNKRLGEGLGGGVDQCLWNKQINRRKAHDAEVKWMIGKSKWAAVYAHRQKQETTMATCWRNSGRAYIKWPDIPFTDIL